MNALLVVSFIGAVRPQGGGTLVLSGSHRLVLHQTAAMTAAERALTPKAHRARLYGSHPWLAALTTPGPPPAGRIASVMQEGARIDGAPVRVVELTGEPGDMVFCHPCLIHCVAPNRGDWPRFMRIRQQLLTDEGRRLAGRAATT